MAHLNEFMITPHKNSHSFFGKSTDDMVSRYVGPAESMVNCSKSQHTIQSRPCPVTFDAYLEFVNKIQRLS